MFRPDSVESRGARPAPPAPVRSRFTRTGTGRGRGQAGEDGYERPSRRSASKRNARAFCHSRLIVRSDTSITAAVSSTDSPPKAELDHAVPDAR